MMAGYRLWTFTVLDKGAASEERLGMEIRALTAEEVAKFEKITGNIRPPTKEGKNGMTIYLEDDPDHVEKVRAAQRKKRVAYLELAVKDFVIPGEKVEEKVEWLYGKLPIGVIEAIYGAINELSGDPFKDALFTSTAS